MKDTILQPIAKKANKSRINIVLARAIYHAGKRLAKSDRRSFSNLLEVLIADEDARQRALEAQRAAVVVGDKKEEAA